ncbi:hypothetical protein NX862_07635 [Rhodobacter sp. KR11]|uniref:hypothetical protein n=1 Tax=Rhodobacter sp. KR11 TaxID=2974588 RepID=UPI002222A45E|nr:hypothetical protein [Rhodobacter sp. KR11]MCW1918620.1 hypothetical protein [Rhodobacter sp. KR11]
MSRTTITQMADRVSGLMAERLKIKGPLEVQVTRARRRLPREVFAAAEALAEAVKLSANPKFMARIDDEAVAISYDILVRHLNGVGRSARRKGMLLDVAARIAFALLVVGGLWLAAIYWRGNL